jgi:predicted transporter
MKKLVPNQEGFIPMLLAILFVVGAIIVLAYLRVSSAQ